MKGLAIRKSHSCWWNSHISSRNSKWLSENLQETDRLFNEILKLIEEDGDSFIRKAQMYYQRRPELISHIEGFYRLYRALAERYDNVTTELAKNIPTELQSQDSMNGSEFSIEVPSPSLPSSPERTSEKKLNHLKPHSRAAGFDVFLGFMETSDHPRKGFYESLSESGSDCDNGRVLDGFENSSKLEARIIELENELREVRDKVQKYKNGSEKWSEHSQFSPTTSSSSDQPVSANKIFTSLDKQIEELQAGLPGHEQEIENLKEAVGAALKQFETEILYRDDTIKGFKTWTSTLLNKFVVDNSSQNSSLEAMREEESSNILSQERTELEAKISSLMISNSTYGSKLRLFEETIRQLEDDKSNLCTESEKCIGELHRSIEEYRMRNDSLTFERDELNAQVINLIEDIESWDDESRKIDAQLNELHVEHAELIQEIEEARNYSDELTNRVKELEVVVEAQKAVIVDCAEGKKEAIRQLCFSLEHYRIRYQELWQIVQVKLKGLKL